MKTYITRNPESKFGYQVLFDDKILDVLDIVDDGKTLKLPENPSNRKYFSIKKVEESNGTIELTYKESKTFGPRTNTSTTPKVSTKGWMEYLTDEEKTILDEIKTKAERRAEKAKLLAQIEADKARIEELEAQE